MVPFISIVVPSYIIFSTIGAIFAIIFLFFRMERFKIKFSSLIIYCIISVIFLVICSRLVFLIGIIPTLAKSFSLSKLLFYVFNGGIVFYGGMLGVLLGIKVAAKIRKENAGDFYNFAAPAIPLFHVFGRLGCFFGGCCYGKPASWGFAMASDPEILRIPVQLIESGCNLLIFVALMVYEKRTEIGNRHTLRAYLTMYAVCRFILEFFRGDSERGLWGPLSTSQIISAVILVCCIVSFVKGKNVKDTGDTNDKKLL